MKKYLILTIGILIFLGHTPKIYANDFKGIYMRTYSNYDKMVEDTALKTLKTQTGFLSDDIKDIVYEGHIKNKDYMLCKDILSGKTSTTNNKSAVLTSEELNNCYEKITEAYTLEKDLSLLRFELEQDILPTEIWSNGSLDDSSFDLVVDLNIIDVILFGEHSEIIGTNNAINDINELIADDTTENTNTTGASATNISDTKVTGTTESNTTGTGISTTDTNTQPGYCKDPLSIDAVIDTSNLIKTSSSIQTEKQALQYEKDNIYGGIFSSLETKDNQCEGQPVYGFCLPEYSFCEEQNISNDISSASFSMCLDVEFIMNDSDSEYKTHSNCIDCHITSINKTLKKLLQYNVTAEKNTLQSWEINHQYTFKHGITAGFTFWLLFKPIWQPVKDTFIEEQPFTGNALSSIRKTLTADINKAKGDKIFGIPDPDRQSKILINKTKPGTSLTDLIDKEEINQSKINEKLKNLLESNYLNSKIRYTQNYFEAVETEMRKMNAYFAAFQEMFRLMGSEEANGLVHKLKTNINTECTQ